MLAGSRSAQFGSLRSGAKSGNVFLGERIKKHRETREKRGVASFFCQMSKDLAPSEGDW